MDSASSTSANDYVDFDGTEHYNKAKSNAMGQIGV